jgi:hypothetical protein
LGQSHAQLDGFKSRALRAKGPTQRHLYVTKWRQMRAASGAGATVLAIGDDKAAECERLSSRVSHAELATTLRNAERAAVAVAVATQRGCLAALPLFALEVALALIQMQTSKTLEPNVWLLTTGAQVPSDHAAHAGSWGLSRASRAEASLPVMCADVPEHLDFAHGLFLVEPETVLVPNEHLVPRLAHASHVTEINACATSECHFITGGTGGLGLLTARWLAQRGARLLTLASRGGTVARDMVDEWGQVQASSATTLAQRCDTAETTHVRRLVLADLARLPTTGVWHAAGVLADGVLPKQTAGSLAHVYAPKVHGAWMLQHACARTPLHICALFSSVAANSFIE